VVTTPVAVIVRHCPAEVERLVMAREVEVALVPKKFPVVKAVDDAYGNCDAATVDDEKKTPWVRIDVVVAAVLVAKVFSEVNGYENIVALVR